MANSQEVKQKGLATLTGAETVGNEVVLPVKEWELLAELCQNLNKNIEHDVPTGNSVDNPVGLKDILLAYGKQEFLKKFGFQWKEDLQGRDIPGYQSKMVPRVYNVLFEFPGPNPGRPLIEDHVGRRAFKKDGWEFPWKPRDPKYKAIQEVLFNDLCDRVEHLSTPEGKEENKWYDLVGTVRYPPDPDHPSSFVKQYFFFVYAFGKKHGRHVLFIFYLSVFCGDPASEPPFLQSQQLHALNL